MKNHKFDIGDTVYFHNGGKENPLVKGKLIAILNDLPGWENNPQYVIEVETSVDAMLYIRELYSLSPDAKGPILLWRR